MAVTISGTVKFGGAYDVNGKDGSKKVMVSFTVVDQIGNLYACQMWPDNAQHARLVQVISQMRFQSVQVVVQAFSVRLREYKDKVPGPGDAVRNGKVVDASANFIVSQVYFPDYPDLFTAQPAATVQPGSATV